MRALICLCVGLTFFAVGCRRDIPKMADDHVRKNLLAKRDKREAIPFFEEKGSFFDQDSSTSVDKDVLLPLLKRLQEVAPTEQWVMLKPGQTNEAFALLVALPGDSAVVDRMAEAVQESDDKFSGFILQQWGHEWLSIDLVNQETYEFLKKSNPDIDKQR